MSQSNISKKATPRQPNLKSILRPPNPQSTASLPTTSNSSPPVPQFNYLPKPMCKKVGNVFPDSFGNESESESDDCCEKKDVKSDKIESNAKEDKLVWDCEKAHFLKVIIDFDCPLCSYKLERNCRCFEKRGFYVDKVVVLSSVIDATGFEDVHLWTSQHINNVFAMKNMQIEPWLWKFAGCDGIIVPILSQPHIQKASKNLIEQIHKAYWINRQKTKEIVEDVATPKHLKKFVKSLDEVNVDAVTVLVSKRIPEHVAETALKFSMDHSLLGELAIDLDNDGRRNIKETTFRRKFDVFIEERKMSESKS